MFPINRSRTLSPSRPPLDLRTGTNSAGLFSALTVRIRRQAFRNTVYVDLR